jgi:hypothetical protein
MHRSRPHFVRSASPLQFKLNCVFPTACPYGVIWWHEGYYIQHLLSSPLLFVVCNAFDFSWPSSHHSPLHQQANMTTKAPTHIHDHVYNSTTLARNAERKHIWLVFSSIVKGECIQIYIIIEQTKMILFKLAIPHELSCFIYPSKWHLLDGGCFFFFLETAKKRGSIYFSLSLFITLLVPN